MGSHSVNLEGDLKKLRIDVNGNIIEEIHAVSGEHEGHAHD